MAERTVEHAPDPAIELVVVLRTGDPGMIAVVESLFEGEGIEYELRNDRTQDLFGAGRIGGYSVVTGPAEFVVRAEDAERAREVLTEMAPSPEHAAPPE